MLFRPAALLALASCAAPQTTKTSAPVPVPPASAPVTSAVCDRAKLPPPTAGMRRFELRLDAGPGGVVVKVDGVARAESRSSGAPACAYFELAPGNHEVTLVGQGEGGVGVNVTLVDQNDKGTYWYDVFALQCGMPGTCERDLLTAWRSAAQADRKKLTDPCSATQVRNLKWESQRLPDMAHVSELDLSFTLFIYSQAFWGSFDKPPRDPACPVE